VFLRMAPEKHEAFAAACEWIPKRARIHFFLKSVALRIHRRLLCGPVTRRSLFDLRFQRAARASVITIGGIRRAEGAGSAAGRDLGVTSAETWTLALSDLGTEMLALDSVPEQRLFRHSPAVQCLEREKCGEWRSTAPTIVRETLPEEATESNDRTRSIFSRFEKVQRDI